MATHRLPLPRSADPLANSPGTRATRRAKAARLAVGLALASGLAGCHRQPVPGMHVWSADEVQYELLLQLQRIGDLSGYVVNASPDGQTVFVLAPPRDDVDRQACTTPQRPTAMRQALAEDAMQRASVSFEALDRSMGRGVSTHFEPFTQRHQCDVPDTAGWKPLTVEQVGQLTTLQLQRIGELTRYIRAVAPDGTIQIWSYAPWDEACRSRLQTFPSGQPVGKAGIVLVERALNAANAALADGRDPKVVRTEPPVDCAAP